MKALCVLFALAILGGLIAWERKTINGLSVQNQALYTDKIEAERLAEENRQLSGLRDNPQTGLEPGANTELLRLRNEVRQLRAQQGELEKLRASNRRVADELKSGQFVPRRLAEVEGSVPREKWSFAGFATPEATVQSFFAGLSSGDPEQIITCMSPHDAEQFKKQLADDPEKTRKEFAQEFAKLGRTSAFRITGTRNAGADKIEVMVQVVADGQSMPLPLVRVNQEWKIGD